MMIMIIIIILIIILIVTVIILMLIVTVIMLIITILWIFRSSRFRDMRSRFPPIPFRGSAADRVHGPTSRLGKNTVVTP